MVLVVLFSLTSWIWSNLWSNEVKFQSETWEKNDYEFDSSLLFRSKKANMKLLQESNCCQILFFWLLVYLSFESLELIIFISRICSSWQLYETYGNFFSYLHYILKNSDFCHWCAINSRQTFPKFQQNVSHVKYFAWKNYFWVSTAS